MRKAQTEIMGLAIVIILIILGMTFLIRFMMSKEPIEYKKEFTQAELASNTLNTFLETTSNDCGLSMAEILQNCGQGGGICGEDSCEYVKRIARDEIFKNTLDEWNIAYEFRVFFDENNQKITLGTACVGSKKSKTFPIPTSAGTLSVRLDICG